MIKKLVTQDELEIECPIYSDDLIEFLSNHKGLKDNPEMTVYVLAQILHEKLTEINMELSDKGAVVATIVGGLVEFNEDALAVHNEMKRLVLEQKASTLH